jgi:hypothetical protein
VVHLLAAGPGRIGAAAAAPRPQNHNGETAVDATADRRHRREEAAAWKEDSRPAAAADRDKQRPPVAATVRVVVTGDNCVAVHCV